MICVFKGVERHLLLPREGVDLRGQREAAQEDGTCLGINWYRKMGFTKESDQDYQWNSSSSCDCPLPTE